MKKTILLLCATIYASVLFAQSDLAINIVASSNEPKVGENVVFTLTVKNNDAAVYGTDVKVTAVIPAGYDYVSDSGNGAFTSSTGVWSIASLPASSNATLDITVVVNPLGNYAFPVSVELASDTDLTNNSASITPVPVPQANLNVTVDSALVPVAGGNVSYTIRFENAGPSDAAGVTVVSAVSDRLTNVQYALNSGALTAWSGSLPVGTLTAGGNGSLVITGNVLASATGELPFEVSINSTTDDPVPANNSATADATITVASNAGISVTQTSATPVAGGGAFDYTITFTNTGVSDATGVTITGVLPSQLSNPQYTLNGGTSTAWTGSVAVGTLTAGGNGSLVITGTLPASATGAMSFAPSIVSTSFDTDETNNSATADATITVASDAGISVTQTSAAPVAGGGAFDYTITFANTGVSDATGVTITGVLPAQLSNPQYTLNGGTSTAWTGSVAIGTLTAGGNGSLVITGTLPASATGAMSFVPSIASVSFDTDETNNSATADATITVASNAGISVTQTSATPVAGGGAFDYTVTFANTGVSDATGVTITGVLPSQLSNPQYTLNGGTSTAWTGSVAIGTLTAGGNGSLVITGTLPASATGAMSFAPSIASTSFDTDETNNLATADATITVASDLSLSVTQSVDPAVAGDTITYTINYINNGPSDQFSAVITCTSPSTLSALEYSTNGGTSWQTWTGSFNTGSLPANASSNTLLLRGKISAAATAAFNNVFAITVPVNDPVTTNNTATLITSVTTRADLEITSFTQSPLTSIFAGELLTCTVTYKNNGPSNSLGSITIAHNPSTALTDLEYNTGTSWQTWTGTLTVNGLDAGVPNSFTIRGKVPATLQAGSVSNTVTITHGGTNDTDTENNSKTLSIAVQQSADLETVSVTPSHNSIVAGTEITYDAVYRNNGPSNSTSVVLSDNSTMLNLENRQYSLNDAAFESWAGSYEIGDLSPNAVVRIQIKGKVPAGTVASSLVYEATITGSVTDPNSGNNKKSVTNQITTSADLKTVSIAQQPAGAVTAGTDVIYSVNYRNDGPSNALGITLQDNSSLFLSNRQYRLNESDEWKTWTGTYTLAAMEVTASGNLSIQIRGTVPPGRKENFTCTATLNSSTTPDPNNENNGASIATTVTTSADLQLTSAALHATTTKAVAGSEIILAVSYKNAGPSNSDNVTVIDNSTFLSNRQYSLNGGQSWQSWEGSYSIPNLTVAAGEQTILIKGTLAPSASGNIPYTVTIDSETTTDTQSGNDSKTVNIPVDVVADMELSGITYTPAAPIAGNEIICTVQYKNNGPSNASGFMLSDNSLTPSTLLTDVTFSVDDTNWSTWTGSYSLPALAANAAGTLKIKGIIPAGQTASIEYSAKIAGSTNDSIETNNIKTVNIPVSTLSAFSVSVTQEPASSVNAGEEVIYTITVVNNGPSYAVNTVLTDAYPSATLTETVFSDDNGVTWETWNRSYAVPQMIKDDNFVIKVKGKINPNAIPGNTFNYTATAKSDNSGTSTYQNSASTLIHALVDVQIGSFTANPSSGVIAGNSVTYAATVKNNGPSNARGVKIALDIAPEFETVEYSLDESSWIQWTGSYTVPNPLTATVEFPIWIRAKIKSATALNTQITKIITANSENQFTTEKNNNNNSASTAITVNTSADVSITKSIDNTTPKTGSIVVFTITVSNAGPSDASSVVVTDNLASGYEYVGADYVTGNWNVDSDIWTVGTVAANAVHTLKIMAKVKPSGNFSNTASAASTTHDPNTQNNNASVLNVVPVPQTDLKLEMEIDKANPSVEQVVLFSLKLTNNGPSNAVGASVTSVLPADGYELIQATAAPGTLWADGEWSIPQLTVEGSVTLDISAKIKPQATSYTHTVTAFAGSPAEDPDASNNSVSVTPIITNTAPISVADTFTATEDVNLTVNTTNGVLANDTDIDHNPISVLNFTVNGYEATPAGQVAEFTGGKLRIASGGNLLYEPALDFFGEVTGIYTITDGQLTHSSSYTITVNPVNDAPVATNDNPSVTEDSSVLIDVLANDTDIKDGELGGLNVSTLEIITGSGPTKGTAEIEEGKIRYTPAPNHNGTDEFRYRISDNGQPSTVYTAEARVRITVNAVNDPPVTKEYPLYTAENIGLNFSLLLHVNDSADVNYGLSGGGIDWNTLSITKQPANGYLYILPNQTISYTPNQSFYGEDEAEYEICDRGYPPPSACTVGKIRITVSRLSPLAVNDTASVTEDVPQDIDLLANDNEGEIQNLDYPSLVLTAPKHGKAALNPANDGTIRYTPAQDYYGTDSLTYTVKAKTGMISNVATVYITVAPVADAPRIKNSVITEYTTREDVPVYIPVSDLFTDPEEDIIYSTVTFEEVPLNGTVTLDDETNGIVKYLPDTGFSGNNQFRFSVADETDLRSEIITIKMQVSNEAPIAVNGSETINEDEASELDILKYVSDPKGLIDPATLEIIIAPHNGEAAAQANGSILYTPAPDFYGNDSLTYRIRNTNNYYAQAKLVIAILPVNDAPVAVADFVEMAEASANVILNVLDNDYDVDNSNDQLTVSIAQTPKNGTAVYITQLRQLLYTPNAYFNGLDTMKYRLTDRAGLWTEAYIHIEVTPINIAPVAEDDRYGPVYPEGKLLAVLENDRDRDGNLNPASVTVTHQPAHGEATPQADGTLLYIPHTGYFGYDTLQYSIYDTENLSDSATVVLEVIAGNGPPAASSASFTIDEDTQLTVNTLDYVSDPNGSSDISTASLKIIRSNESGNPTGPFNGDAQTTPDGYIIYTPDADYFGNDIIIYEICDHAGMCDTASFAITVNPVNDAPRTASNFIETFDDTEIVINVSDNDYEVENEPVQYIQLTASPSASGSFMLQANGTLIYRASSGAYRSRITGSCNIDTLICRVCDIYSNCALDTVFIQIKPLDSDGDHIPDYVEKGLLPSERDVIVEAAPVNGPDTDGDGIYDHLDTDSDGDGIPDIDEGGILDACVSDIPLDSNGDGIPDYISTPVMKTFSPNGDGKNDFWIIQGIDGYPNCELSIFNRSGSLVYNKKPYDGTWDGKANASVLGASELPEGVYYYILNYGDGRTAQGSIYLKR